jgi:uncharacterized protein (TIGR03437 family)
MNASMARFFLSFALAVSAVAQSQIGLSSAGYSVSPDSVTAAPGQVLTLSIFGLQNEVPNAVPIPVRATSFPLPTMLAGITVTVSQVSNSFPAPLLAVQQRACNSLAATGCLVMTNITLQIPFEVFVPPPGSLAALPLTTMVIAKNGQPAGTLQVNLMNDNVHVFNGCDSVALALNVQTGCLPLVTHADGSLVTAARPARTGEELVMYAFGLGYTNPAVKSGDVTPHPAPTTRQVFLLSYIFQPNAPPAKPGPDLRASPLPLFPPPLFAGLTEGSAGLYQINLIVPPIPTNSPFLNCGPGVNSNMTVVVSGFNSFDGAPICVTLP